MPVRLPERMDERAFSFLRTNEREQKPRKHRVTEIRGPYYSPLGKRCLQDILETMGNYVDSLNLREDPSA
jgi:phosphosulfolactate synthase (CoM biosynthesis protein A)